MIPLRLSCSHGALLVFLLDLLFSSPGRDKESKQQSEEDKEGKRQAG